MKNPIVRFVIAGISALPLVMLTTNACAQAGPAATYPNKPIHLVVPYPPGGASDILTRLIGSKFTEMWRQPVIVENKPGASGWIGNNMVARASPDGYTILLTISAITFAPSLYSKIPYNVATDFEPISQIARAPNVLAVSSSVPANSLEEFVELVRKNPGKYNYGSFGQGTSSHIYGEALKLQGKIDLVHVPYKGSAAMIQDLIGGQLTAGMPDASTVRPYVKTGKIKLLAVSGTQRVNYIGNVPTFLERGYKGMEPVGYFLMLAPAGTPKPIAKKISGAIAAILRMPDVAAKVDDLGLQTIGGTPEELAVAMKSDAETFGKVIKQANIKVDQ